MYKPVVGVTMGDPAGIGPEISLLGACSEVVNESLRTVLIGDSARLEKVVAILKTSGQMKGTDVHLNAIHRVTDAQFRAGVIDVIDIQNVPAQLQWGETSTAAGKAAYAYLEKGVELALDGQLDAICTAPIHKEAWSMSDIPYPGHTEAIASMTGSEKFAMMLVNDNLRVVHVSTHVSLQSAIALVKKDRIVDTAVLLNRALIQLGLDSPRIGIAGLNPHAGENGLFGDEEILEIVPAVKKLQTAGVNVIGPLPPDTVFMRAAQGEFDGVVALYHDQGHIAVKMLGLDNGVNVTIGLPIIRTSVDHGTAFDIAGRGIADYTSMVTALLTAGQLVQSRV